MTKFSVLKLASYFLFVSSNLNPVALWEARQLGWGWLWRADKRTWHRSGAPLGFSFGSPWNFLLKSLICLNVLFENISFYTRSLLNIFNICFGFKNVYLFSFSGHLLSELSYSQNGDFFGGQTTLMQNLWMLTSQMRDPDWCLDKMILTWHGHELDDAVNKPMWS